MIDVYAVVQSKVKQAFDGPLKLVTVNFTLSYVTASTFDTATGMTVPGTAVTESSRGILDNEKSDTSWDFNTIQYDYQEKTLLILNSELKSQLLIGTYDYYVIIGLAKYRLVEFKTDPVKATYLCRLIPDNRL